MLRDGLPSPACVVVPLANRLENDGAVADEGIANEGVMK